MRWRNQIIALICLLLFAALGVLYFQNWVIQKPFAIILFVGEGLTAQRLAATRVYAGGADNSLAIDGLAVTARVRNFSADFAVPDSGSAASALATGVRVKNGTISVADSGVPLPTLLEIAHGEGRATAIVTDGALTNPGIAAFYAHSASPTQPSEIGYALIQQANIDIALGGGAVNVHVTEGIESSHIHLVQNLPELEEISAWQRPRVLGLFAQADLPFSDELAARSDLPSLADMVRRSIQLLQVNRRGYVLVVQAHLMGSAAVQNAGERTLRETAELDHAVQVARDYAGNSAAIIVTGDVAIGGMNINGHPFRYDSGVAILGLNSAGQPWITWATGPNGARIPRPINTENPHGPLVVEPAAIETPAALNSLEDPIANAAGVRIERLHGTIDSTEIFSLLRDAL